MIDSTLGTGLDPSFYGILPTTGIVALIIGVIVLVYKLVRAYWETQKFRTETHKLRTELEKLQSPFGLQAKPGEIEAFRGKYLSYIWNYFYLLDLSRAGGSSAPKLPLNEIYISLDSTTKSAVNPESLRSSLNGLNFYQGSLAQTLLALRHAVLIGDQGSGKTTVLQYIALCCAAQTEERLRIFETDELLVPIPIRLSELSQSDLLQSFAPDQLIDLIGSGALKGTYPPGFFVSVLEHGEAIFLFDGLDEISDEALRRQVALWIDSLVSYYSSNRFIITSRPSAALQSPLKKIASEIWIDDLDFEQIRRLILNMWKYLPASGDEPIAFDLIEEIRTSAELLQLAKNPLMLSTIVLLAHERNAVKNGYQIYNAILNLLYARDADRNIHVLPSWLSQPLLEELLGLLALRCLQIGSLSLGPLDVTGLSSQLILDALPKGQTITLGLLQAISDRIGILEVVNGSIGFNNALFRDLLAAHYIGSHIGGATRLLSQHLVDESWRGTFLAYSALHGSGHLIPEILGGDDTFGRDRLFLASDCAAISRSTVSRETLAMITDELLQLLFNSPYTSLVRKSAQSLSRLPSDGLVDQLTTIVSDGSNNDAPLAANLLSMMRGERIERSITDLLSKSLNREVVCQLLGGLTGCSDDNLLRILIAILENSEEPDHRWRAARALGGRGDANGLYALLRSLAEDHDSDVRRIAADAIAQMSSIIEIATPLLSPVLDLLVVEKDPLVRRHMCEILRNLPGSEQRISSFVLDASNPSEECRALEALYWLNATGQQWIFIKGLKSNKDEGVRVVCASALRNAADGDARKVLSKTALEDRSEYVRATSIEALLPEEIERCADDLLTIISDESRLSLRIAACKALSRIRHSQLASILKPIIHDPTAEEEFRETALELIWSNRLGDVVEVAVHILLNDSAWRVRAMAAYLLRDARDSKALSALSTAIQYDLHLTVRAWAIESLRLKGDRAAWDVIEKCALSDTSDLVRWRAIESMRFSTFDSAVDVLRQIIVNDKEKPNLREIAIRTVSAMQCPMSMLDSFKTLITNTELRDCAFEAICRLERKTSLPHLP